MGEARTAPGVFFRLAPSWRAHDLWSRAVGKDSVRVRDGGESLEAGPGDFFSVPPHTVHREGNPGAEEQVVVVVRVGTGQSVINVDGPHSE